MHVCVSRWNRELCKNGSTDCTAVWKADLFGPKEPSHVRWAPDPPWDGRLLGEYEPGIPWWTYPVLAPAVFYDTTLPVQHIIGG